MLIYVGAHCKKCNLLARNIDPLTSQGHARWTVAQTDWNFHPPLKLANSLLPQQPVNPHFICVATFNTCYFKVLDCPPLSAKVLGERIWAWISVKRTSHSVKGPLIAWKDREFGGQHFDMSETSRSHTFSWDESTLKSWKMLEMRFDALPTSVYESRMILIESLTIKLCAKQNRAKKTGRWAVFFYVTAPNQP